MEGQGRRLEGQGERLEVDGGSGREAGGGRRLEGVKLGEERGHKTEERIIEKVLELCSGVFLIQGRIQYKAHYRAALDNRKLT